MKALRPIFYAFPVQLVLVHLKRHPLSVLIWLMLFLTIFNAFGKTFGIPYLFLDPEYLGQVNAWSFFLVGLSLGVLIITFQVSSYILNSFRFPFLATLQMPFVTYFLNNSTLPLAFLIAYSIQLYQFQMRSGLADTATIVADLAALLAGVITMSIFLMVYFFSRNTNLAALVRKRKKRGETVEAQMMMKKTLDWESVQRLSRVWTVTNFITRQFRIRPVRGVEHYDERLLLAVFKQHHFNAFLYQVLALSLLIALGFLMDDARFILPAGASILLMMATLLMVTGAFSYWTRGWRFVAFLVLAAVLSLTIRFGAFDYQNHAYGLDYRPPPRPYGSAELMAANNAQAVLADEAYTLSILENWHDKQPERKPPLILLTASGGGHRASMWTFSMLQFLDSLYPGTLMQRTAFMSGASGGMLGLSYFRELYYQQRLGAAIHLQDTTYREALTSDLLNPIAFTIVVNDLFYPWRTFHYAGKTYAKDRGYTFEHYLNRNTGHLFDKPLAAYREPERQADIPMLVLSPTIITDERKLFIAPHPVRYLTRPGLDSVSFFRGGVDGVDFISFFDAFNSDSLRFSTALRLNATYPYVLPTVNLPTDPIIEVMDAGIRDNFGLETATRFLLVFREWIKRHTSKVILINMNSVNSEMLRKPPPQRNLFSKFFNPVGNIYTNWSQIQHFNQQYLLHKTGLLLDGKLEFIEFNYTPGLKQERAASMSFRLTAREKQNILRARTAIPNQESLERLRRALEAN